MEKIKNYYEYFKDLKSDINEHLPTLFEYSKRCSHITEMGVRGVVSSWALIYSNPKRMVSYDIIINNNIFNLIEISKEYSIDFEFKNEDVLLTEIEFTDLLFIDTWHTYNQLFSELNLHSNKVSKYIIFHDTVTYGIIDESMYSHVSNMVIDKPKIKEGLINAINDFLLTDNGSKWEVVKKFENNNGLTILKNINYNEN